MDRIELVERRYRQIVPVPIPDGNKLPLRALESWLQREVTPLVAEYVARPKFRDLATWPIRVFQPGIDHEARRQVDTTSAAFRRQAGLLRMALRSKRVESAIRQIRRRRITEEEVLVRAGETRTLRRTMGEVDRFKELKAQCESIARPFWRDLVCSDDYFQPRSGWMLQDPGQSLTAGDLVLSLNPEFPVMGDFVTEALFRRVEILTKMLEDVRRAINSAVRTSGHVAPKDFSRAVEDSHLMNETLRLLRSTCRPEGDSPIRDSCIVLVQVYAAFHSEPNTEWLGLSEETIATGRILRERVSNMRNLRLTDRIAAALGDLKQLYANEPPAQSALEEAVARGGLVLSLSPILAYWDGKLIDAEWNLSRRPWKLLVETARRSRRGIEIQDRDIFVNGSTSAAMATLMARLKELLPPTLRKLILRGAEPRSYRLVLESSRITII